MDDPDSIMLRFLRARKWNVSAGVAMLAACIKWRIEYNVSKLVYDGEEGLAKSSGFKSLLQKGMSFTQGAKFFNWRLARNKYLFGIRV